MRCRLHFHIVVHIRKVHKDLLVRMLEDSVVVHRQSKRFCVLVVVEHEGPRHGQVVLVWSGRRPLCVQFNFPYGYEVVAPEVGHQFELPLRGRRKLYGPRRVVPLGRVCELPRTILQHPRPVLFAVEINKPRARAVAVRENSQHGHLCG